MAKDFAHSRKLEFKLDSLPKQYSDPRPAG